MMYDAELGTAPAAARGNGRIQPFDVDLGGRIRAHRVAAGMSQTALGQAVGVTFQQVQKYELAKDRVSASTLFLFATALNVPVSSFFEGVPRHVPTRPARSGAGDKLSAKIVILFHQIDDPGIRKHLVALAAALTESQARGAAEIADEDDP